MNERFSLVELMTVIAIIAVLAAIAVPQFYLYQLDAKAAELVANTQSLLEAELAYNSAHDTFVITEPAFYPDATPGKTTRPWVANPLDAIGWAPDGDVYGSYTTAIVPVTGGEAITIQAMTDLDVDGASGGQYRAVQSASRTTGEAIVKSEAFCYPAMVVIPEMRCW